MLAPELWSTKELALILLPAGGSYHNPHLRHALCGPGQIADVDSKSTISESVQEWHYRCDLAFLGHLERLAGKIPTGHELRPAFDRVYRDVGVYVRELFPGHLYIGLRLPPVPELLWELNCGVKVLLPNEEISPAPLGSPGVPQSPAARPRAATKPRPYQPELFGHG